MLLSEKKCFRAAAVFAVAACVMMQSACAKENTGAVKSSVQADAVAVEKAVKADPELEKLQKVLSLMTDRCKAAIPNGDPKEFIADLKKVLASEKDFSSDDLSPFYLIDKKHNVGSAYEPKKLIHLENCESFSVNKNTLSLRPEAYNALMVMGAAAEKAGVHLTISSTYRSYQYQVNLFNYWVQQDGLKEAERESARAGTSQHQLGMALDFAPISNGFASTPEGKWVYAHAGEYGWSLSFPQEYEDVTGYRWESWHFRYIGKEAVKFQKKWFGNVQQFMIEFIDAWKNAD